MYVKTLMCLQILRDLMTGAFPMVPDISFPSVDVRDVARAHVMVMANESYSGRFLLSEGTYTFKNLCEITKAQGFSQVCM